MSESIIEPVKVHAGVPIQVTNAARVFVRAVSEGFKLGENIADEQDRQINELGIAITVMVNTMFHDWTEQHGAPNGFAEILIGGLGQGIGTATSQTFNDTITALILDQIRAAALIVAKTHSEFAAELDRDKRYDS